MSRYAGYIQQKPAGCRARSRHRNRTDVPSVPL
jgi:hypothetical protein